MSNTLSQWRYRPWSCRISTFKHWYHSSFAILIRNFINLFSYPFVFKLSDSCVVWIVKMIFFMGVKSCRNEYKIWFEFYELWNHLITNNFPPFLWSCSPWDNRVIENAPGGIFFLSLYFKTSVWVESFSMQMYRLKQYILTILFIKPGLEQCWLTRIIIPKHRTIWLFFEYNRFLHALNDLLSSISMMHIKINNCNSFYLISVSAFQICCSQSNIINVAKSICLLLIALIIFESLSKYSRVMARGPYSTKSISHLVWHYLITGFDYRSWS